MDADSEDVVSALSSTRLLTPETEVYTVPAVRNTVPPFVFMVTPEGTLDAAYTATRPPLPPPLSPCWPCRQLAE